MYSRPAIIFTNIILCFVGPTMKLRRNIVIDLYSETIDKFYDEEKTSETPHEPALKQ